MHLWTIGIHLGNQLIFKMHPLLFEFLMAITKFKSKELLIKVVEQNTLKSNMNISKGLNMNCNS